MHFSNVIAIDVRVDLRGCNVCMTKHFLNRAQVCTAFKQVRGKRMTKQMWMKMCGDPGLQSPLLNDLPDGHARESASA